MTRVSHDDLADSDEVLAARAATGDARALARLAWRYQPTLLRYLQRLTRDRHAAEDATQDVLVSVLTRLDLFDTTRPFRAWVFAIAHKRAVTLHRRESMFRRWLNGRARRDATERESTSPGERVATRDAADNLWYRVRSALPPDAYTAVWMFYVEQASIEEIAAALDRRSGAVKTMLHRARARLAEALEDLPARHDVPVARTGEVHA